MLMANYLKLEIPNKKPSLNLSYAIFKNLFQHMLRSGKIWSTKYYHNFLSKTEFFVRFMYENNLLDRKLFGLFSPGSEENC